MVVVWSATLSIDDLWKCCACYLKLRVIQCILWEVHCLCRMCQRLLLVVLWLRIGTLSLAHPGFRTSQYRRTFVPLSVSLWNEVGDPVFDGVGQAGFKSRANAFCWPYLLFLSPISYFSSFHRFVVWALSLRIDRLYRAVPMSVICTVQICAASAGNRPHNLPHTCRSISQPSPQPSLPMRPLRESELSLTSTMWTYRADIFRCLAASHVILTTSATYICIKLAYRLDVRRAIMAFTGNWGQRTQLQDIQQQMWRCNSIKHFL